jgi:AraC family transcriptional regulator of adaptative response/methylated-DNA-[protein]-cysteine methyltransferase
MRARLADEEFMSKDRSAPSTPKPYSKRQPGGYPMQATQAAEHNDAILTDPRWQALCTRRAGAGHAFFYAVVTTGVYCRPSCGARRPRPENVRFFSTVREAEAAGFRACKRCRPKEPCIADVCRVIEQAESAPNLTALAERAGLSRFHFHRVFKAVTGVTPAEYAAARRGARVRSALRQGATVTEAIYSAGFSSSGRFYEQADKMLGMKPAAFRAGGAKAEIAVASGDSSLGKVLVAQTSRGVCAILLGEAEEPLTQDLRQRFPQSTLRRATADEQAIVARAIALVEMPEAAIDLPLDIQGTVFQKRVWKALRGIRPGTTATYAEIAAAIKMPQAARAVARACAANKIAVAIPCHRVIGKNGALSGYRWGVARKQVLLARESSTRRPKGGPAQTRPTAKG